ncbi:hypothetical protein [Bartonella sp. MM73XJBT.G]|uniref:hypothetical protein n=1 Tax=Bartonella sp. MM73XJBT.G TaxID=3019097 RepID=UPI00235E6441|nr:hypothetical protein [Bartonella sp. MM73XJBT.G]
MNSNKLNTAISVAAQYILSHPTLQSPTSQRIKVNPHCFVKKQSLSSQGTLEIHRKRFPLSADLRGLKAQQTSLESPHL